MRKLDAALLALEAEVFSDDAALTDNDAFLVRALSEWSPARRQDVLLALIDGYGTPDISAHIVHALARLICRDVEAQIDRIFGRVNHLPG
jgi:hypothetical protein